MQISPEELAIHGNQVVCPQCLTVYGIEGNELTAQQVIAQRKGVLQQGAVGYCYQCGARLPKGNFNFCPYCGVDLQALFESRLAHQSVTQDGEEEGSPANEPVAATNIPSVAERKVNADMGDMLRNLAPAHLPMQNRVSPKSIASLRFRIVAYIVIALLVLVFIAIVIAGNLLEQ